MLTFSKIKRKIVNIFLPYVLDAQKNCLTETMLLNTHNIYFGREIRKLMFCYALLLKGLVNVCKSTFG